MAQRWALPAKDAPDKVRSSQGEKSTAPWGKGNPKAFKFSINECNCQL
jgi:hypothetical protein